MSIISYSINLEKQRALFDISVIIVICIVYRFSAKSGFAFEFKQKFTVCFYKYEINLSYFDPFQLNKLVEVNFNKFQWIASRCYHFSIVREWNLKVNKDNAQTSDLAGFANFYTARKFYQRAGDRRLLGLPGRFNVRLALWDWIQIFASQYGNLNSYLTLKNWTVLKKVRL